MCVITVCSYHIVIGSKNRHCTGNQRFLTDGMLPEGGDVERLTTLLGRPLRSYRDFASKTAASA